MEEKFYLFRGYVVIIMSTMDAVARLMPKFVLDILSSLKLSDVQGCSK